jgi:hypothetical protein
VLRAANLCCLEVLHTRSKVVLTKQGSERAWGEKDNDTTAKDKIICNIVGVRAPSGRPVPVICTGFPPPSSAQVPTFKLCWKWSPYLTENKLRVCYNHKVVNIRKEHMEGTCSIFMLNFSHDIFSDLFSNTRTRCGCGRCTQGSCPAVPPQRTYLFRQHWCLCFETVKLTAARKCVFRCVRGAAP